MMLEKSMIIDPWELISNPTILDNPISKSKKSIFFVWIALGAFIATLVSLTKEYISDLIFNKEKIIDSLNYKLIAILNNKDEEKDWNKEIMIPFNENDIEKLKKENINLISLGNVKNKNRKKIFSIFKDNFKNIKECDLETLKKESINILLIEKGTIKRNDLKRFFQKIKIYNLKINYWILID